MITYIKRNVPGNYVVRATELEPELFDNIGTTFRDYLDNKWVKLNEDQIKFHETYPYATIEEVWNTVLTKDTFEYIKADLIKKIHNYDSSRFVNSFKINGIIEGWFTVSERNNYKASIEAAKLLNIETLDFYINNTMLSIPTTTAELFLAQIQLYADKCFIVTKQHINNVNNITDIDKLKEYDYTTNYPEKLNFNL